MTQSVQWMDTLEAPQGIERAKEHFREIFDADPSVVVAAPGRVNLIGEHVDYAGGISVPFALHNRAYIAAAARPDDVLRVSSVGADPAVVECRIDEVGPKHPDNWAGYVIGAVWAAIEAGILPEQGMDLAMVSDVPLGAGLSSSAAIECSAITAAMALAGMEMTPRRRRRLVECAMRAENEVVGASTGGMDQRISLLAQEDNALAIDFLDNSEQLVPFDVGAAGYTLVVCNTNAPHSLADGQYASRRAVIDGVTAHAHVATLREVEDPFAVAQQWAAQNVPEGSTEEEWQEVVHRRVRHVISEIERTSEAVQMLVDGNLQGFGEHMWASHASLRDDYEVSTEELDLVVDTAREFGALGARMTGGGFGGSAIALIDIRTATELVEAINERAAERGYPQPEFLLAMPGWGARIVESAHGRFSHT
ncbi:MULTISPECIES: galactokinase [Corynebacterium]|uniref:galactokinase n=1 Tax=Corynebacterium TaxID=1716 RepID=UPI00124F2467|nr:MULTISPECIES: galactokinase [Corynebacterium]MBV7281102.1 galactokinase [Corynebacterium sp. TAE3-ERU30]MBV7301673.1 galactokinase [Corynebacterium sp. TAE3-ERU2]